MDALENLISMLDYILNSRRKRHIAGGILLSSSAFFGCLALTIMTIRREDDKNE